jgi:Ice-binding-like
VAPVHLNNASSFGVLAGTTVTNTGPTVVNGDLGVSPGTAVTGFPPGTVNGTIHSADAAAASAQTALTAGYIDAASRTPTTSGLSSIGNQTLTPGVYNASSSLGVNGTLTLDGQGDINSVFIFQIGSALTTASASTIVPTNGAQACNVFWQVGSSATLGTGSTFLGNILALTSITVTTGDTISGRALARNGAVTLDDDTITVPPTCPETPIPVAAPPVVGSAAGLASLAFVGWFLVRRRRGSHV